MANSSQPYVRPGEPLHEFLRSFWQRQIDAAEQEAPDYRHPPLPLARIKKVMKSDPDVKMIAADAPILFCKACEIFIAEITARAFIIADSNKRRTLSRADIAKAISKSDQFDFLIDVVPREEPFSASAAAGPAAAAASKSQAKKATAYGPISKGDQKKLPNLTGDDSQVSSILLDQQSPPTDVPPSIVLDQLQTLLSPTEPLEPRRMP